MGSISGAAPDLDSALEEDVQENKTEKIFLLGTWQINIMINI